MKTNLFEFKEYKKYIRNQLKTGDFGSQGVMAGSIRCQPAYVSQVLNGDAHLSLEQADLVNEFFHHGKEESHFFLLMVQKERAGTKSLKEYFQKQLDELLKKRTEVSHRLDVNTTLSDKEQAVYYSSWFYAAIHIAVSIPRLRSKSDLAEFLHLPIQQVSEALEFLLQTGLVEQGQDRYTVGKARIFVAKNSPHSHQHHANWRHQAIESLDREQEKELHYTSIFSLTEEDAVRLKDRILDMIKENNKLISASKEEEVFCFTMDLFSSKKTL
jgi:uncharacterized protein (TIGR02147 family)